MAKNVIIRNNENTEIICSEVDTIILPTADGGTASFKDWNGIDKGSNIKTQLCCRNIILEPLQNLSTANIKTSITIPSYTIQNLSSSFSLTSDGYYTSASIGHNGYCVCQVDLNLKKPTQVIFDCISYGENNYDYGILSQVNTSLTLNKNADSTNVFKSFYGLSSPNVQSVDYGIIPVGKSFIQAKYRKDGSGTSGTDSFKFKLNLIPQEEAV